MLRSGFTVETSTENLMSVYSYMVKGPGERHKQPPDRDNHRSTVQRLVYRGVGALGRGAAGSCIQIKEVKRAYPNKRAIDFNVRSLCS